MGVDAKKAYFQPPSNLTLEYPCLVYYKKPRYTDRANNKIYTSMNYYSVTFITKNPDSLLPEMLEEEFQHAKIVNGFTQDNLHHTILNIYY